MTHFLIDYDVYFRTSMVLDILGFIIFALIAYTSYSYYKICKSVKFFTLTSGFVILLIGELFEFLKNFLIHYGFVTPISNCANEIVVLTYSCSNIDWSIYALVLLSRFFTLFGIYTLFNLFYDRSKTDYYLMSILLLIIAIISTTYSELFHLTFFVISLLIALSYHKCYCERSNKSSLVIMISFVFLALSSVVFVLFEPTYMLYAVSEVSKFLGLLLLWGALIYMRKYDTKRKMGHNCRHA